MCEPMTASLLLTAASGIAGANAANKAAKAQNAAYLQNAKNASNAMLADARALNQREDQESQAAAQDKFMNTINAAKARASTIVSSGEAGVYSGANLGYLLNNVEREKLRESQTVNRNLKMTTDQLASERAGLKYAFNDRVNSVQKGQGVDPLIAGLGIAATGAGQIGQATGYGTTGTYKFGKGITPKKIT